MVKKLLTLTMGLVVATGLMAQSSPKSVTINESDIQFWTGNGTNSTVVAIGWDDDDASYTPTVVVWGVHWSGTITLQNALDTIMAYDSRFSYTISGSFLTGLSFVDPGAGVSLTPSMGLNCNSYGGAYGSTNLSGTWLRISESTCNNYNFTGVNNLIYASDPNASSTLPDTVDASLPFSEITYWVGTGTDSAEFIVNFAQPDTAFAWGYLFNGTTTAQAMIDAIAVADPRFWIEGSPSLSGDIHFITDNGDTLGLSPIDPTVGYNFWWTNLNGVSTGSGAASTLHNGDVFKYGDLNSATGWDYASGYYMEEAWNTIPTPVSVPDTTPETPVEATIAFEDILYWVGNGSDSAIFVISNGAATRAWGYLFDEDDELTALDMALDVDAADPRLVYTITDWTTYDMGFTYKEGATIISIPDTRFKVNGVLADAGDMLSDYDIANGSIVVVSTDTGNTWTTPITAATVEHMPVNSTIDASDILYWIGSGTNEAIVVVNWGVPDTALAWGIRFADALTIGGAIDSIAAADPRVTTDATHTTIDYTEGDVSLSFQPAPASYMQFIVDDNSNVNATTPLGNGQQLKIGESAYGTGYDSTEYMGSWFPMGVVWNTPIHPATIPGTTPVDETPVEATIAFEDILYWVGSGLNKAILAVNWADTALAWGYRWNGTKTVADMMADIATADPRFSVVNGAWGIDDILFNDGNVSLAITPGNYWGSTNNGVEDMGMGQTLSDGDLEKWGDPAAGVVVDSNNYGGPTWYYTYAYPMTIHPVSVPDIVLEDATIAAEDIHYWIGEGENEAIFVVNWATKTYAWGYRFSTESVSLAAMMDDIAAADERFAYSMDGGYLNDITYTDGAEQLAITPGNWWEHSINDASSSGMAAYIHDGDFSRWADPAAGVAVDSTYYEGSGWFYSYVYPMTITPATQPYVAGPFCGIVGSEGCNAIAADSNVFVAWATACTVDLGPQNISVEGSPLVSYRTAEEAVGPCNMTDNLSVVSLGDGGSATLTFAQPIADGPGPDFAVFENSWGDYFLELAFVEVSSDGERFVRFPATSLTQTTTQVVSSVDPTFINNLAGKFRMGYGTPFDLSELRDSTGIDLNAITHVRVVDVVGSIDPQYATYDAFGHIVNDPWPTDSYSGGFDLDGIGVINVAGNGIDDVDATSISIYPNPTADLLNISTNTAATAELYDFSGRLVMEFDVRKSNSTIDISALPAGVYMLRMAGTVQKVVKM
ncbi:MAG: T9SS type A sorting domain-containing protein [Bacteroidales bacterium]|nr:T9SS type A sorting domain-containing protein [Bacteroidales bacterium]